MVLMNCFVSSMVERDESGWLRMANLPAVLASYWPLLAALWVLDVFLIYGSQLTYVQLKTEITIKRQKVGMKSLWHPG